MAKYMRLRELIAISLGVGLITVSGWAGPLHDTARTGDAAAIERLIAAGADVEAQDEAVLTPLIVAALAGHKDIVTLLIAKGADPSRRDGNGFMPLHAAAHAGHTDIVRLLVEHGVDVNDQQNMAHITPLHAAAERGFVAIARILIAHGAKVDMRAGRGHTPVAMATLNTHPEMVKLLRDHGADCSYFKSSVSRRYRDYCLSAGS